VFLRSAWQWFSPAASAGPLRDIPYRASGES
jgi:hypothetical protein